MKRVVIILFSFIVCLLLFLSCSQMIKNYTSPKDDDVPWIKTNLPVNPAKGVYRNDTQDILLPLRG